MRFVVRTGTKADCGAIGELMRESVLGLQPEYTERQRETALRTVFTPDSQLIADRTYFVAEAEGMLAGCGGWSFRRTLYGGDHHVEQSDDGVLDPETDAARVRAIFVRPRFARHGVGTLLLQTAEDAARSAGFQRFEMASTLAGIALYMRKGYIEESRHQVPVGGGLSVEVVHMTKQDSTLRNVTAQQAEREIRR